jgi:uncharacterized protein YeaO (DUF488 family)
MVKRLPDSSDPLHQLRQRTKPVTLLFAPKDTKRNNAVVLSDYLTSKRTG